MLPEKEHLSLEFLTREIKETCLLLKPVKAPGLDDIHNEFITHLGPKLLKWVTCFCNVFFNTNHIPKLWRLASIVAILKPRKM